MNNYSERSNIEQFKLNEAKKRMYSGKGMSSSNGMGAMTNSSEMGTMTSSSNSGMGASLSNSTSVGQNEIADARKNMTSSTGTMSNMK